MSWTVHLYWLLGWLVFGFCLMEGWAIVHHRKADTFSNTVWVWLGVYAHPKSRLIRHTIFTFFWCGLYVHLDDGWSAWPWLIIPAVPLVGLIVISTFIWKEKA